MQTKFVDEAVITVGSGKGGDGGLSFRREKFVPMGGPDGGNGGRGGDVIFEATESMKTLIDFKYKRRFFAEDGEKGGQQLRSGPAGKDILIQVPVGTTIKNYETDEVLADLSVHKARIVLLKGGRGGLGNEHFKSSVNQAPRRIVHGGPAQELVVKLELKLLADVAIVGFPNAGKSTFIKVVSNARPKVADYPFTTLIPNLGVVRVDDDRSFIMVDVPGLIEGAHEGKGLGIRFLKHIERCRMLLHFIEMGEVDDVISRFETIQNELGAYNEELLERPMMVVITKMDAYDDVDLKKLKTYFKKKKLPLFPISSLSQKGVSELVNSIADKVGSTR